MVPLTFLNPSHHITKTRQSAKDAGFLLPAARRPAAALVTLARFLEDMLHPAFGRMRRVFHAMPDCSCGVGCGVPGFLCRMAGLTGGFLRVLLDVLLGLGQVGICLLYTSPSPRDA